MSAPPETGAPPQNGGQECPPHPKLAPHRRMADRNVRPTRDWRPTGKWRTRMSALLDILLCSLHHSPPMPGLIAEPRQQAVVLLFLGGLGLLISVMLAARAMEFEQDATPRRRILAHWLPIVAAVLLATLLGYGEMGVAMIFGTSVAMLSVVSGFVALSGPLMDVPAQARRMWPFLPVLATLVFVLGLRGTLGVFEVTAFGVQGLLLFLLWGSVKYS